MLSLLVNQETALDHRECEAPASSTRLSARTHLPHVSLTFTGKGKCATNRASQSQVLLPHFLPLPSLTPSPHETFESTATLFTVVPRCPSDPEPAAAVHGLNPSTHHSGSCPRRNA